MASLRVGNQISWVDEINHAKMGSVCNLRGADWIPQAICRPENDPQVSSQTGKQNLIYLLAHVACPAFHSFTNRTSPTSDRIITKIDLETYSKTAFTTAWYIKYLWICMHVSCIPWGAPVSLRLRCATLQYSKLRIMHNSYMILWIHR